MILFSLARTEPSFIVSEGANQQTADLQEVLGGGMAQRHNRFGARHSPQARDKACCDLLQGMGPDLKRCSCYWVFIAPCGWWLGNPSSKRFRTCLFSLAPFAAKLPAVPKVGSCQRAMPSLTALAHSVSCARLTYPASLAASPALAQPGSLHPCLPRLGFLGVHTACSHTCPLHSLLPSLTDPREL